LLLEQSGQQLIIIHVSVLIEPTAFSSKKHLQRLALGALLVKAHSMRQIRHADPDAAARLEDA
jgi:hypothetical protein